MAPRPAGRLAPDRHSPVICFPAGERRAWPGLPAWLSVTRAWRRCVVICGRRYWRPG